MLKQLKRLIIPALILAFLVLFVPKGESNAEAVGVSAIIGQTLTFGLSTNSTDFGTLSSGSINTSTPNITLTISTNAANGFSIVVKDEGDGVNPGLYKSTAPTKLIASSTATLVAGTEGYGIQAATTGAGSGATVTLATTYNKSGNDVGGLNRTDTSLASATGPVSGREVVITHKAAISGMTLAGSYADTITYTCTGNF